MALVWEDDFDAEISIESVKFQVSMLRKKLPKDSIKNVYGKGYVLN
jgi:DNA-binding response OmpR family regulator